jgi:hypothetical protein
MTHESDDLAEAHRQGAGEADAFDRRLREREREERDERSSRLAGSGANGANAASPAHDAVERPSLDELAARREIERLTSYYNAVENSRAWRFTQRVRRLMGRAW